MSAARPPAPEPEHPPIGTPGTRPPDDGFIGAAEDDDLDHFPAALDSEAHLLRFELELRNGRHWFDALLECIAAWSAPREIVDGREYVYLIAGEAFDWLVLAERLCEAVPPDLLPQAEVEALLWHRQVPVLLTEPEFKQRLGAAKHWAHLNFEYGVRVEQALQLAVERNLLKESGGIAFSHARRDPDADLHNRIYGAGESSLLEEFRDATGRDHGDRVSQSEWQAFTYWLHRRRVERQDPARVASDTRLGLTMLQELEEAARARRRAREADPEDAAERGDAIEAVVVAVG